MEWMAAHVLKSTTLAEIPAEWDIQISRFFIQISRFNMPPGTLDIYFFLNCIITRMLSSTYRIDERSSSDGIMYCLL